MKSTTRLTLSLTTVLLGALLGLVALSGPAAAQSPEPQTEAEQQEQGDADVNEDSDDGGEHDEFEDGFENGPPGFGRFEEHLGAGDFFEFDEAGFGRGDGPRAFGFAVFLLSGLVVLAGIGTGAYFLGRSQGRGGGSEALTLLERRFVDGDISQEEFTSMRADLKRK